MTKRRWSADHIAALRARYPDELTSGLAQEVGRSPRAVHEKANSLGLRKSAAFLASPEACLATVGTHLGKGYRYPKGYVPANKGVLGWTPGGRSAETQFKPGRKPCNWAPIGSERVSKEGYLQRKLTDTGITRRDFVLVHHIVWRAAGREIPEGHPLTFLDGNNRNFALDNLALVSRQEMMKRNSFHNYGKDIAQLVQLRACITRQINRRESNV